MCETSVQSMIMNEGMNEKGWSSVKSVSIISFQHLSFLQKPWYQHTSKGWFWAKADHLNSSYPIGESDFTVWWEIIFVQHHKGNDIYLYSPVEHKGENVVLMYPLWKISSDLQRPAILGAITLHEEPTNCFCLPVLVHHASHLILIFFHFMLSRSENLSNSGCYAF